jgi:hypothetical protein
MTESTRAVSAATTGGIPYAAKAPAAKTTKSFADELAKSAGTSASSTKAAARPDNEQTKKISGHPYARIENGADKGRYLNQLASSPRLGSVFRMVERDDRVFHVYGSGTDRVIVEVKAKAATDTTTATTPPATSTATTTPATS